MWWNHDSATITAIKKLKYEKTMDVADAAIGRDRHKSVWRFKKGMPSILQGIPEYFRIDQKIKELAREGAIR